MAWTYDGDPSESDVAAIHFLVGDTDSADPQLQDEEIELLVSLYPRPSGKPPYLAAAAAADAIAGKYARKMNQSVGPLSQQEEQQYLHYVQLAQQFRLLAATDGKGVANQTLRVVPASPILGGGGRTYLGENNLPTGGAL